MHTVNGVMYVTPNELKDVHLDGYHPDDFQRAEYYWECIKPNGNLCGKTEIFILIDGSPLDEQIRKMVEHHNKKDKRWKYYASQREFEVRQ